MDEMLSQEEINALLNGMNDEDAEENTFELSEQEIDAIGEVSNISMGTAATTLFTLVNQKVTITTPKVSILQWEDVLKTDEDSFVAIQIVYKVGLSGTNLLLIKERDAKIISDLMMGGDGSNVDGELTELHLSAVSEAMNQMIGSAATSMSSLFNKKIDINPPQSSKINQEEIMDPMEIADFLQKEFIGVSFKMQIGDLIDSEMLQLYPPEFAKEISANFLESKDDQESKQTPQNQDTPMNNKGETSTQANSQLMNNQPINNQPMNNQPMNNQQPVNNGIPNGSDYSQQNNPYYNTNNQQGNSFRNIEVQQAQFQNFDMESIIQQKENIDLIMDVSLEVTVELGRTHKAIKDILEFAPGTILELNKLAGEPIDVLVNGKIVAKGEVVVIDENFGIRITDIIKQSGKIM